MRRSRSYVKFAHVAVLAVGDAGISSLQRVSQGEIYGVDLFAINTDLRKKHESYPLQFITLDSSVTGGFSAGGQAKLGKLAAERTADMLRETIRNYDMLFIVAGLGGGTGSGATPVIAQLAHELDILTMGIVYMPFEIEGQKAIQRAQDALAELKPYVDTLITISNDHLAQLHNGRGSLNSIFRCGDQVITRSIRIIDDLLSRAGIINVDFADIRAIMQKQTVTLMTRGRATGSGRAARAASQATHCPILNTTIHGAKNILLNITGGSDLDLFEIEEIVDTIQKIITPSGYFIFSTVYDELLEGTVEVMVIASGFPTYEEFGTTKLINEIDTTDSELPANKDICHSYNFLPRNTSDPEQSGINTKYCLNSSGIYTASD